jgi:hypothetical protein
VILRVKTSGNPGGWVISPGIHGSSATWLDKTIEDPANNRELEAFAAAHELTLEGPTIELDVTAKSYRQLKLQAFWR